MPFITYRTCEEAKLFRPCVAFSDVILRLQSFLKDPKLLLLDDDEDDDDETS